ncbi:TRAP transporter large permease [Sulfitobacter sp. PS-8MA]|uniref:TRAP transporter large permease n=1 Tax=Sulfitobacter sp. PS-8MA TaxID=3237707 RepID=UPI0034C5CC32
MSDIALGLWSFPVLLALIFLRIPIGFAMMAVGAAGTYLVSGTTMMTLASLKTLTFGTFSNYALSIIPLFLLMGQLAMLSGMSRALFKAAEAWLGHLRGGLAMSAIGASAGFGAICGSSLATAATMGQVALPELKAAGYSGRMATGTLAAGGTLGILIPPSVALVIYAILAEQNIAKLFMAALIPGILAAIGYMITISVVMRMRNEPGRLLDKLPVAERFRALIPVWPVITIFAVVVGGIYAGIFTPTEAAAVGAAGTAIAAVATRQLTLRRMVEACLTTARGTGMIFIIILGAGMFNSFLALTLLPQTAALWVADQGFSPWTVMIAVLVIYLVLGCVMDSLSMILLTVPIFFPLMVTLDFGMTADDFGLWFGILVLTIVEVGLITPPVGMNLFVINSMDRQTPILQTFGGAFPFVVADLIRIAFLTAAAPVTLALVWLFY